MLYREIIAVCSQIHTKHINTLCGQNVGLLNVKPGGTYSDHWISDGCVTGVVFQSRLEITATRALISITIRSSSNKLNLLPPL